MLQAGNVFFPVRLVVNTYVFDLVFHGGNLYLGSLHFFLDDLQEKRIAKKAFSGDHS